MLGFSGYTSTRVKTEESSISFGQKVIMPSQEKGTQEQPSQVTPKPSVSTPTNTVVNVVSVPTQTSTVMPSSQAKPTTTANDATRNIIIAGAGSKSNNINTNITVPTNERPSDSVKDIKPGSTPFKDPNQGATRGDQACAIIIGSVFKSKSEIADLINESKKVDLSLGLKSKDSALLELNLLQYPTLEQESVYNFYIPTEEYIFTEEDPQNDPLFNAPIREVPRYIKLTWKPIIVEEKASYEAKKGKDEKEKIKEDLTKPKGYLTQNNSSNLISKNSYESQKKKISPINKDGMQIKLIDSHNIEKAFDLASNTRLYKNSADVILNSKEFTDVVKTAITFGILEKK